MLPPENTRYVEDLLAVSLGRLEFPIAPKQTTIQRADVEQIDPHEGLAPTETAIVQALTTAVSNNVTLPAETPNGQLAQDDLDDLWEATVVSLREQAPSAGRADLSGLVGPRQQQPPADSSRAGEL